MRISASSRTAGRLRVAGVFALTLLLLALAYVPALRAAAASGSGDQGPRLLAVDSIPDLHAGSGERPADAVRLTRVAGSCVPDDPRPARAVRRAPRCIETPMPVMVRRERQPARAPPIS